ncbi:MFS transporter [Arthrobacter sp. CAU 1506]|uniref:MFS transporter n=1 Tax=Arthrobacter sp. CAU 1506 TaxID=2560052 RepID=UPI0010AD581E|nr:MFS transporter [Arthrobacter sp. CAU 1506]TJY70802.1 MFS transporter [Arthrobacter sp. CAU 1506]
MSVTLTSARPATGTDRGIYTYIAVYSAVLYMVLLIAPVIAGKLIAQYSLTPTELGMLFSLELGAFSLATVPAYLWLNRLNLRTVTYVCTAVAIAGNLVSGFLDSFALLVLVRVVTSLAAGSITVIILTLSGKTANPSRGFGVFVVFQLLMGAVILFAFPALYADADVSAIYWTMAALTACCLPVVRMIDGDLLRRPREASNVLATADVPAAEQSPAPAASRVKFVIGLAAVLLFYIGLSGVWSFMAQISGGAGIDLATSSLVLAIATIPGIAAPLVATFLGDSPKRKWFLLIGYLALGGSVALLFGAPGLIRFALAALVFKFAWTFILPYLLASLSDIGGSHVMNSTNLMIGTGFAIGPVVSGMLIESAGGGFGGMLLLAVVAVLVSMGCAMAIQRPARA